MVTLFDQSNGLVGKGKAGWAECVPWNPHGGWEEGCPLTSVWAVATFQMATVVISTFSHFYFQ